MDAFAREVALTLKAQTNVMLFGSRDSGKTSFTTVLARELQASHGPDAPPHLVVTVNLERAFSIPAFISAVHDAMTNSTSADVRRAARSQIASLEKEIGFDIKVIKAAVKRPAAARERDAETLHAQLQALARLGKHVVVAFDEFQRLNRCPGNPLSIIRSALMGLGSGHVSLVFTGSIREALEMMLRNSEEPIFNEAAPIELPAIREPEFFDFLVLNFEATGRPVSEEAAIHLLRISRCHPKRTQHLAWKTWRNAGDGETIEIEDVERAFDELFEEARSEFVIIEELLATGDEAQENERRALYLLADHGGENVTSRKLTELYGFGAHTTASDALERLAGRGLVQKRARKWEIGDPFFAEWLRRKSPFAL